MHFEVAESQLHYCHYRQILPQTNAFCIVVIQSRLSEVPHNSD